MRFRLGSSMRRVVALAAALALTAGIGVATGAIPSSSGKIYGCFAKDGGRLRVIDKAAGQKCQSAEKALNWNQQGPKGDPGAIPALQLRNASITVPPGERRRLRSVCGAGEVVASGGFATNANPGIVVTDSNTVSAGEVGRPEGNTLVGWEAVFANETSQATFVIVEAVCAPA